MPERPTPPGSAPVWAVIPVHNRRDLSLACLRHLREIGALGWLKPCVVDDGSSDGTGDAIEREFPGTVVLRGAGDFWWTGSIALGMRHALHDAPNRALFWLNDDCRPAPGALELLLAVATAERCLTVAQVGDGTRVWHGGARQRWRGLELVVCPPGETRSVDTMNGNCVCLPPSVTSTLGLPDAARFPQAWGDTDFGLRCHRAGITIKVLGAAACTDACPLDDATTSWLRGTSSVATIARSFRTPKNYFFPPPWWRFNVRHWGAWGAVLFTLPYFRFAVIAALRAIVPLGTRRRWFGS